MSKLTAWSLPAAAVVLVGGGAVYTASAASASPELPAVTAQELLVRVAEAEAPALSGTVRTTSDLGLPEIPDGLLGAGDSRATAESSSADPQALLTRLLTGDSTIRVWSDADERFRASLEDEFTELVLVRDGDTAWAYSSEDATATRFDLCDLPEHDALSDGPESDLEGATPQALAQQLLDAADPSTEVSVGATQRVAGQDAYTLVVDPRAEETLVERIEVAVDAGTGLVLDVSVYAVDQADPAFRTGFARIAYETPDDEVFSFSPPEGTTVEDVDLSDAGMRGSGWDGADADELSGFDMGEFDIGEFGAEEGVTVLGEGWATILRLDTAVTGDAGPGDVEAPVQEPLSGAEDTDPQAVVDGLTTPVDGGRAISTALLSVLLTDDGRVLVGPVTVESLVDAAS